MWNDIVETIKKTHLFNFSKLKEAKEKRII